LTYTYREIFTIRQKLLQALKEREPFALIRCGEKEGYALMYPKYIQRREYDYLLRFWFGRNDFSHEDLLSLRSLLVTAINNADMIGRKRNPVTAYIEELANLMHIPTVSHDVHIGLWFEEIIEHLFKYVQNVVLITCRGELKDQMANTWEGLNFTLIEVPEEGNLLKEPNDHWPDQYHQVIEQIAHVNQFSLFLVGAGVLGKSYCSQAKNHGHIALDMGSVLDGWAGVVSRGYLAKDIESFKLEQ
jgi:hypothetical protein